MSIPLCNQADLHDVGPRVVREPRCYDAKGYEQTQRRNGAYQCPECGLWWPVIEDPCVWVQEDKSPDETTPVRWLAIGWEGFPVCEFCGLLVVEQPNGTSEVYQL